MAIGRCAALNVMYGINYLAGSFTCITLCALCMFNV